MDEYESIEALKLRLLQTRATQAKADIEAGNTVDGESFFDGLENGRQSTTRHSSLTFSGHAASPAN